MKLKRKCKSYHIVASENYAVKDYKIVKFKFLSRRYFKKFCKKYPNSEVCIEKYIINKYLSGTFNVDTVTVEKRKEMKME